MKLLKNAPEIGSRNGKTKELTQVCISHSDPTDRLISFESRKEDLIAQIAETLWVVGGSRQLKYLSPFLPRAIDYSDDQTVWRAGYGFRIRNYAGEVDQLKEVLNILKTDLYSRRAFLAITDSRVDLSPGKDIACNQMINFLVRPDENGIDRLNMTVTNRSNDFQWGYSGINFYEFSFLQEFVANLLGVKLGYYLHNSMSFHLYEQHWERVDEMIAESNRESLFPVEVNTKCPEVYFSSLEEFDYLFSAYKSAIESLNSGTNTFDVWNNFRQVLCKDYKESYIFFEIPILYLCLKDQLFAFDQKVQSYISDKYYKEESLFFKKVSKKFKKRIERHNYAKP